jgi:5-methylcytosine-specific restriction protein A
MEQILREPLENYLQEKKSSFAGNELANRLRKDLPRLLAEILDTNRYKVVGSPGKGNWADTPWIAILDLLVTDTPQSGYYPVFLFKADMTGVYLSINQGVTKIEEDYKKSAIDILKLRANDFRAKINISEKELIKIGLESKNKNAKLYEAGNIIARFYPASDLPNSEKLITDIRYYINLYEELTFNSSQVDNEQDLTAIERKQYRLHYRIERNSGISKKVKERKGYTCEACKFNFSDKYGELGHKFVEAHHLTPISNLEIGKFEINIEQDFAVLCSNCHSMIHRLDDPSDLGKLRKIVKENKIKNTTI